MKQIICSIALSLAALTAQAQNANSVRNRIHILPDAPSSAYQALPKSVLFATKPTRSVQSAIILGERNLEWLKHMNSFRPEGSKLQLTKPGDLKGIPIEDPKSYNARMVTEEYKKIQTEMPAAMKDILYSNKPFPKDPTVSEEDYILWANKVDKNYQTATRWNIMVPWIPQLKAERQQDLRGFYFLSMKTENVESFLRSIHTQPQDKQAETKEWLTQMCQNTKGLSAGCETQAQKSIKDQKAYEFYLKSLPGSQEIWDSFFSLHNPRQEVKWTSSNPMEMLVPFRDPKDKTILEFLKLNIEDEWKWEKWNLRLGFTKNADIRVEFEPGAVPHVNGLGGNTIVMDKNAPLSEWDVQWTIRHEFGHVLGFTDCYLEFYDPKQEAIVTYQLDIENLMCARSGRMQEGHYETLKASYLK